MLLQAAEQVAGEVKRDYEQQLTQLRAQYEERQCLLLTELRKKQRQSADIKTAIAETKVKLAKVKEEKAKAGHESNRLSALIVQSPERMKTEIASMKTQLTQVRLEIASIKTQLRSGRLSYTCMCTADWWLAQSSMMCMRTCL